MHVYKMRDMWVSIIMSEKDLGIPVSFSDASYYHGGGQW